MNKKHSHSPRSRLPSKKGGKKEELPKSLSGILSVNSKGVGFLTNEKLKQDIEIPTENLHTALNKDEVEVRLFPKVDKFRQTGEVTRIVKRAKLKFAGHVIHNGVELGFVPDDKRLYLEVRIEDEASLGAQPQDKVFLELIEFSEKNPIAKARVLEIIGKQGEHNAEMKAILLEKGIASDFPDAVVKEAEHIAKHEKALTPEELSKRKDFRDTLTFTIDPVDAKDFDDAISIKPLGSETFEVGVHIADVSHYVREGTALDREARERGLSTYLVDRVIPMLPEILSNDLCSLNPHEDKFTFSAVFTMNMKAEVLTRWFGKTIINSNKRFSYEDVQATLDRKSGEYFEELNTLNQMAYKLRAEKMKNGAIDFEHDEVKFELDGDGKPIRVFKKKRFDAHKLVEEFMLLANREVAMFMSKAIENKESSFIYRIHDTPDEERIADLALFVKALGYDLSVKQKGVSIKDLQALLSSVEGKPEESLIKTAAIRSMAKAVYSVENIGHYGLAFEFYTHFTSPIRRYADLLVHRLLQREILKGKIPKGEWGLYKKLAEETSEKEVKAAEAERASIKYKQVEYMMDKVGKIFDGTISGVTEWGLYIEENETKSEGMIRLRDLGSDYYALDKKRYAIVGEKTKKEFRLGDKVKFKILRADLENKTLDLALVQ